VASRERGEFIGSPNVKKDEFAGHQNSSSLCRNNAASNAVELVAWVIMPFARSQQAPNAPMAWKVREKRNLRSGANNWRREAREHNVAITFDCARLNVVEEGHEAEIHVELLVAVEER
jgi:hypothetical protein